MNQPPKHHIRQSFERAAATYDAAAQVQRRICGRLAKGLPMDREPRVILDAGCGTGYATGLLRARFPQADIIGLDLAPAMLGKILPPTLRVAADVEHLPLAAASVDLYWSSLTLQWCDLAAALREARHVLRPGSHLAAATLGPETFAELRTAFAAGDDYRHTLAFHSPEQIGELLAAAGFTAIDIRRSQEICHYPDLRTLLGAVKAIGANQVGPGRRPGLMSRKAWDRVEAAYEALRQPAGLPLSYDVIAFYANP